MATSPSLCCSTSCVILSDDFNRAGPGPGCQWDVRQGNWSVTSNRLRESGTSGALVIAERAVPNLSFHVGVNVPSVTSGAVYRVIANYKDDGNYYFAEFVFTSTSTTIRIYRRESSNNLLLVERSWTSDDFTGAENSLILCLSDKLALAIQSHAPYSVWVVNPSLFSTGHKAGLGNGSGTQIDYDAFNLSEMRDTNSSCDPCGCRCNDVVLPMTLHAEVTLVSGFAACSPLTVTLHARDPDSPNFFSEIVEWYGTGTVDCSECPGSTKSLDVEVAMRCDCGDDPPGLFTIWFSAYFGADEACNTSVTCSPFDAVFPTLLAFSQSGGDCSGDPQDPVGVNIEVTE